MALAGTGVVLLTGGGTAHLSVPGVIFAGLAAVGWAGYIMLSAATGRRFPGSSGLVIAMLVAAVVVTPAALATANGSLRRPAVLATGAAVGLLSSAIPYGVELRALRRLPTRVFGIWMSLEPAVAALIGLALLGQHLTAGEWTAVGCVVAACTGAARSAPPAPHAPHAPRSPQAPLYAEAPLPRAGRTQRHLRIHWTAAAARTGTERGRGRNTGGDGTGGDRDGRGPGRNADRDERGPDTDGDGTRTGTERGQGRNADGAHHARRRGGLRARGDQGR